MNRTRRSIGTSPKHLTQSLLQQKMWTDLVATANRGGWKLHHQQTNDSELIEAAWREQGRAVVDKYEEKLHVASQLVHLEGFLISFLFSSEEIAFSGND